MNMEIVVANESELATLTTRQKWLAYLELTKPRISVMVLLSIVAAAFVAAGGLVPLGPALHVAIGMFLVAASGNAANMYVERHTDFLMPRTMRRPLPDRRLGARDVAGFAAITLGIGMGYLIATMPLSVVLVAAGTWILYVLVYTPLKMRTPLNTEVGAIPGAVPVLVGAMAPGVALPLASWAFFVMMVFWQFPHFMAIAWLYREDYRQGGLQMITVTDPTGRAAGRKAVLYAVLVLIASLGPLLSFQNGWIPIPFAIAAVLLGAWYLLDSVRFAREPGTGTARRLLKTSVIYLPLYMVCLVLLAALGR